MRASLADGAQPIVEVSMESDREIVKRHVTALLKEASEANVPRDLIGRLLLQEAIEIWRSERTNADIESELRFAVETLDPDTDFEFMRP
jgi:hypothetical protein